MRYFQDAEVLEKLKFIHRGKTHPYCWFVSLVPSRTQPGFAERVERIISSDEDILEDAFCRLPGRDNDGLLVITIWQWCIVHTERCAQTRRAQTN
jgi:hypothetical protein